MKKSFHLSAVLVIVCLTLIACNQSNSGLSGQQNKLDIKFSKLSGPYLGQKPPGMIPGIFAPGIISTGNNEVCISFSLDAKEMFYSLAGYPHSLILTVKEENGEWHSPRVAPFSGKYSEEFLISPDGKKIFIVSGAPVDEDGPPNLKWKVWESNYSNGKWSKAVLLNEPINSDKYSLDYVSSALNGNLYFCSNDYSGVIGGTDIFMSTRSEKFLERIEPVDFGINTEAWELDPFIAKDESFIIFSSNRKGGLGRFDLYISFNNEDGTWTAAKNMGDIINSEYQEVHPSVSLDGKYLFFCSNRYAGKRYSNKVLSYEEKLDFLSKPGNSSDDIYWVDAKVIEKLKPDN